MMTQKTGALIFDETADRYDIRFDVNDYYGGLHCGDCMEVFVRGKWKPTRMEYGDNWYLVGILSLIHISTRRSVLCRFLLVHLGRPELFGRHLLYFVARSLTERARPEGMYYGTVSYTHLDVYKRQQLFRCIIYFDYI